jgi:hypothetical protein
MFHARELDACDWRISVHRQIASARIPVHAKKNIQWKAVMRSKLPLVMPFGEIMQPMSIFFGEIVQFNGHCSDLFYF